MNLTKHTALAASLALAFAASVPLLSEPARANDNTQRTAGQAIDDATITASVKTRLLEDDRTDGFDINVDTVKGHVTLRGGADTMADREAATQVARMVDGVVSVDNQLTVANKGTERRQEANEATASGKTREIADETTDEVDDAWITGKVKSQFLADSDVTGLTINVDTEDNVVTLTGEVPSQMARDEAIRIAQQTKGVLQVKADRLIVSR